MLASGYSLASLCLLAALALLLALLLQLAENRLNLLRVIPSPLSGWEAVCRYLLRKLNRQGRSSTTLQSRGRVLIVTLLAISGLLGSLLALFFADLNNDYVEVVVLALVFLMLPPQSLPPAKDPSSDYRHQIESDAITLLERNLAPVVGWLLFDWGGILIMLTTIILRGSVTSIQSPIATPIRRLSRLILFLTGLLGVGSLALAAFFTSKGKPLPALRAGLQEMLQPYQAILLTIAEALGLSLAGPSNLHPDLLGREWLGSGIARLQQPDAKRWHWHLMISQCLLIALLLLLSLLL